MYGYILLLCARMYIYMFMCVNQGLCGHALLFKSPYCIGRGCMLWRTSSHSIVSGIKPYTPFTLNHSRWSHTRHHLAYTYRVWPKEQSGVIFRCSMRLHFFNAVEFAWLFVLCMPITCDAVRFMVVEA